VGSLVGAKASDLLLSKLAAAVLKKAKWPTAVKTGRFMFDLGVNPRNTADVDEVAERRTQPEQMVVPDAYEKIPLPQL
jgi:hypothetical protein